MGTTAHVIVVGGGPGLAAYAEHRIAALEAKWSRFIPTSELCRLNERAGRPVVLSAETFDVVARAVEAWFTTGGRFDPTILRALVAAGYDRTFADLPADLPAAPVHAPSAGCAGIAVMPSARAVLLPDGVGLDLGGIGKGRAADLVVEELLERGAAGACVNLGGDLRVAGEAPTGDGWVVTVDHPFDPDIEIARLALNDGAVVTTTRAKRHWRAGGVPAHHLIDPATGAPAASGLAAVTVVAGDATTAEVLAKAAFVGGIDVAERVLAAGGATGLLVDDDGLVHSPAALEVFAV